MPLSAPAVYMPWLKGVYEVAPGLRGFGTDFGNGELDRKLFQLDSEYFKYRENKLRCIDERPSKYLARHDFEPDVEAEVASFIRGRLLEEWPEHFAVEGERVRCHLTGDLFEPTLDNLLLHVQEDLAVVRRNENKDWIAYLFVCSPSHWDGATKMGRSFFESHLPVPGFGRVNAVAPAMVDSMINKGPFVRFVWGIDSDDRLNHHPEPRPGVDPLEWEGRQFENGWFARTERQTIWGLPNVDSAMFFIRVSFVAPSRLEGSPEQWAALKSAALSMSPEARSYKGVQGFIDRYCS